LSIGVRREIQVNTEFARGFHEQDPQDDRPSEAEEHGFE
jgi:hypothetical protein